MLSLTTSCALLPKHNLNTPSPWNADAKPFQRKMLLIGTDCHPTLTQTSIYLIFRCVGSKRCCDIALPRRLQRECCYDGETDPCNSCTEYQNDMRAASHNCDLLQNTWVLTGDMECQMRALRSTQLPYHHEQYHDSNAHTWRKNWNQMLQDQWV